MKKVLVFINSASRQGAASADIVDAWLRQNNIEVLNESQANLGSKNMLDVIRQFREVADACIIGGGDGSVNHGLPALINTRLPVLLIPLGTANNLARTLQIPTNILEALTLLLQGKITEIDIGNANGIPFVNVIGIGMSARVNRAVAAESKRWLGALAFAMTALRVAARMTPFRVTIECDGQLHRARSWQVTVCNGRNYGNGLTINENATLTDQTLHALSTEVGKWWHGLRLIPSLLAGHFNAGQKVTMFEGKEIRIFTSRSKHVDIDGDIKTRTPVKISILPLALKIYVPEAN